MTRLRLAASENEFVKPFDTYDSVFENCEILYNLDEGFSKNTSIILDEVEVDTLKIEFGITSDDISFLLDAPKEQLKLAVISRDQDGHNYSVLHECAVDEIQETPDLLSKVPSNISKGRFSVSVILTRDSGEEGFSVFRKLAQKDFRFVNANQKIDFPRIWRTADEFQAAGLPRTSLWHLAWVGEDFDKPINELVILWMNSEYKTPLQVIGASLTDEHFQRIWTANVLAYLVQTILVRSILEDTTQSLAFKTIDGHMKGLLYEDHDHLRSLVQRSDFGSLVGACAHHLASVAEAVEKKRV